MTNNTQLSVTESLRGKTGYQRLDGLYYPVRILDARKVFGRIDILITPVGGRGERWTQADTIVFEVS